MANSGIVYSSYGRNSRVYVSWSVAETDIENSRWKINWEAGIVVEKNDYWYNNAVKINSIFIDGGASLGSGTYSNIIGTGTYKKLSGSKWISSNTDGKKNIAVSINGWFYSYGNVTGSNTFDLPSIPKQANLLTAPNFSDGANPIVTYSNPAGNAVTSLEIGIFNDEGSQSYVPYKNDISKTGTSYTFDLTNAERENLRNAASNSNSIPVRFYIRTKIGENTYLSYLERTFSIEDANPIITASVWDINSVTRELTGDINKLVKFYSNARAFMEVEAQKGAVIDESLYIIRNGNETANANSRTFLNVESNMFTFTAEDSRGNVGREQLTIPMVNYVKLTCHIANNRPDALGNMTVACSGDYFNDTFGAVANTLTVQYRYAITGGTFSEWTNMSVTKNGNSYYASADFDIPDFVQTRSYTFETRATDKLATVTSTSGAVRSIPMFHWGENDFVFEVPVSFNGGVEGEIGESATYEGDKIITGNLRLKGSGNYGNTLLFGDGTYCYISEPSDDEMLIHATKLHLDVSGGVFVDGYAIPILDKGIWTPTLNSSAVSSYTTQYGWYSKMGQSVTIGFYIKASCKSGYNSTGISISGMPFTPLYSAAGGGMCSGAYVAANQNFQCFVAETSKSITVRTQACNNTASTNLTTSASGCWYPSGGGEITLSGTITFMANS